jgi:hypothetical protein
LSFTGKKGAEVIVQKLREWIRSRELVAEQLLRPFQQSSQKEASSSILPISQAPFWRVLPVLPS